MDYRARDDVSLRLVELLAEIESLSDVCEVPSLLAKLLAGYGLSSVAYLGAGLTERREEGPYLAVTYSPEWVEHYKAARFVDIDPAIQVGLRRMLPIDWGAFDRRDEKVQRMFEEAGEFGLGRQGISLPVHGRHGDRALLSITTNVSDRDWEHARLHFMRDFQLLALHMHHAIARLVGGDRTEKIVALSPRERECLQWIAEGKTYWECAMILGLSEHTVRCYLESARHKLGAANTPQAINKVARANLLSDLP